VLDTSTGTKTDTPIAITPLNVQVVTQQVLQDQQILSLGQALKNVSGVSTGSGGAANNGQSYSTLVLRGFQTDAHFRDGIRLDSFAGDSGTSSLQFANVDSISVLKGPAAVLYGAVEPGGIVNVTTKQPLTIPYASVEQQTGSYGLGRTSIDTTGPLSAGGHLLYRLNASYESDNSFVDYVHNADAFVAPVLRWVPSANSQVTLEYEYHHLNLGQNFGFMPLLDGAPVNASLHLNYGDFSPDVEVTNFWGLTWDQTFKSGWKLRTRLVSNSSNTDGAGIIPEAVSDNVATASSIGVGRGINNVVNHNMMWTATTELSRHFAPAGGVGQTLLVGADFVHYGADGAIRQAGEIDTNISYVDLFNPVNPGTPFSGPTTPLLSDSGTNASLGVYAQDQLVFPGNVFLLAGARFQGLHQTSDVVFPQAPAPASQPKVDAGALTPRIGLLWQPRPFLSLYGNYAQNFGPNQLGDITAAGNTVPPTTATQWEVGAKGSLLNNRLTTTIAYYDIIKTNIPTPDLANPAFVTVTGAARSSGLEFDLQGTLAPTWQAIANYAITNTRVLQSNDPNNPPGSPVGGIPRYLAHLWLTHEFGIAARGFKAGAGIDVNGPQPYSYAGGSGLFIPSHAVVDAMAAYTFALGRDKVRAQLNATNLFNRRYFSDVQVPGFAAVPPYTAITALYGEPFRINAALTWQK